MPNDHVTNMDLKIKGDLVLLIPMICMNSSSFKRSNSMFHKPRLVQGVSVDINLSKY